MPLVAEDGAGSQAVLCRPPGRARVALVLMHPSVSFLHHYALIPLAGRGFAAMGADSRYAGNEAPLLMDRVAADLSAAIGWLRERFDKVVLVGNSGGGALAAYHQALAGMADALIFLNAHRGRAQVLTGWLDPSVSDESDPLSLDPELDMFDPRHGPPYRAEFAERYRSAQEARNRRLSGWARSRLEAGVDQPFVVHRTAADLRFLDLGLDPSDRQPGTYWGPDARAANYAPLGLARFATCRSWLSQWSLDDSPAAAEPNLARCSVPVLVIQGTADQGIYPSDTEALYGAARGDRELHWIRGGTHYFLGQPDHQRQVWDLIEGWLGKRGFTNF